MRNINALAAAAAIATVVAANSAHAIAVRVTSVDPDNAVPSRDAVIPKNARLVAFEDIGNDGGSDFMSFTRIHADGTTEDLTSAAIASDIGSAFVVDLGELSPAEGVSITPSDGDTFTFTVSDVEDTTAPSFDADVDATLTATKEVHRSFLSQTADFLVEGCLPRITDDNQTLLKLDLQLGVDVDNGSATSETLLPVRANDTCATPISFTTSVAGALCIDAVAVDVAGNESAPLHVCADVADEAGGCSQTGSSTASALAMLAVVLAIGRRRRA